MNEFDFIRNYLMRQPRDAGVVLGIGDDAAVLRPRAGFDLHVSKDMLLAGRHFFADVPPDALAHKVLAVNVSDMAAMGAAPRWVLLGAALPELNREWLGAFCDSLFAQAARFGVTLVGGDTTRGELCFSVTVIGEAPSGKALRRDAAQVGDDIWVSGCVGAAAAALQHCLGRLALPDDVFAACEQALLRPEPRVALGQALLGVANAAQDISDGLVQDLGHILRASGVGAELYADNVPVRQDLCALLSDEWRYRCALAGGDDYELLFTAPENRRDAVLAAAAQSGVPVQRVGRIGGQGLRIFDRHGKSVQLQAGGFDHFA